MVWGGGCRLFFVYSWLTRERESRLALVVGLVKPVKKNKLVAHPNLVTWIGVNSYDRMAVKKLKVWLLPSSYYTTRKRACINARREKVKRANFLCETNKRRITVVRRRPGMR